MVIFLLEAAVADSAVRLWALYLGRPPCIKLEDVTVLRPQTDVLSFDTTALAAWINLLEIIDHICEVL